MSESGKHRARQALRCVSARERCVRRATSFRQQSSHCIQPSFFGSSTMECGGRLSTRTINRVHIQKAPLPCPAFLCALLILNFDWRKQQMILNFDSRALHALPTVIMYLSNSLCSFVNPQGGSCWQLSCPILPLGQCALRLMCAFQDSAYDCNRLLYRYCMNGFSPALQPT